VVYKAESALRLNVSCRARRGGADGREHGVVAARRFEDTRRRQLPFGILAAHPQEGRSRVERRSEVVRCRGAV
jgi:hypothetical protein